MQGVKDKLHGKLEPLFWEYDFEDIDISKDRELIIKKVLSHGSVEDLKWLRKAVGDKEIRAFLIRIKGKGIDRRRLRFYQVIFRLPTKEVNIWLNEPAKRIWDNRCQQKEKLPGCCGGWTGGESRPKLGNGAGRRCSEVAFGKETKPWLRRWKLFLCLFQSRSTSVPWKVVVASVTVA